MIDPDRTLRYRTGTKGAQRNFRSPGSMPEKQSGYPLAAVAALLPGSTLSIMIYQSCAGSCSAISGKTSGPLSYEGKPTGISQHM